MGILQRKFARLACAAAVAVAECGAAFAQGERFLQLDADAEIQEKADKAIEFLGILSSVRDLLLVQTIQVFQYGADPNSCNRAIWQGSVDLGRNVVALVATTALDQAASGRWTFKEALSTLNKASLLSEQVEYYSDITAAECKNAGEGMTVSVLSLG